MSTDDTETTLPQATRAPMRHERREVVLTVLAHFDTAYIGAMAIVEQVTKLSRQELRFTLLDGEERTLDDPFLSRKPLELRLEGDEVVLTVAEHHSNIVPWQMLSQRNKFDVKFAGLDPKTQSLDLDGLRNLITPKTKLVSFGHVSNVLGSVNPVEEIVAAARQGAHPDCKILLDACQSVPHMPTSFPDLGVDFAVCSGHKMCAPTGIGFLWGKPEVLEAMPPFMGGGEMIQDVYQTHSTFAKPPGKFEAGTPAICEAIGLGEACDYLAEIGMGRVEEFEHEIGAYMYRELVEKIEGIKIYGPSPDQAPRAALAAFNVEGLHATDVSMILDQYGIAVRSGHHCTQPLMERFGVPATTRASCALYNTPEDIDSLVRALHRVNEIFG